MQKPCKDCPFRSDVSFYLGEDRAEQIVNDVILGDSAFHCHKTLTYCSIDGDGNYIHTGNEKPCIGALLAIAKECGDARANLWARLGSLIGQIDIENLDHSVAVHSPQEFIDAHG
jgi:hypothetical protein